MPEKEENTLLLIVRSPAGLLLEKGGLKSIQLDLIDGKIGIHPGHAPLIAETAQGLIAFEDDQGKTTLPLQAGILTIRANKITIYTHTLQPGQETGEIAPTANDEEFDRLLETIMNTLTLPLEEDGHAEP
jgi:F0F1-type ATP synthase epsilon subunit